MPIFAFSRKDEPVPWGGKRFESVTAHLVGLVLALADPGRRGVILTRLDELADKYSGCLDTGGELRAQRDWLRDEWR